VDSNLYGKSRKEAALPCITQCVLDGALTQVFIDTEINCKQKLGVMHNINSTFRKKNLE
jgi:hypothetical protein